MQEKTHKDYINIIGETAATTKTWSEHCWNVYYFETSKSIVHSMLAGVERGRVLDVGTSHGNWLPFLKAERFRSIVGVEVDEGRAELARKVGYEQIYNCDAANIPEESCTLDAAVSNDVFVHILRLEDKIAVLQEVERLLKPGGVFVFNHTMSRAFGMDRYQVVNHCSFLTIHELLNMVIANTNLEVLDIKPSYFMFRSGAGVIRRWLGRLIVIPPLVHVLRFFDRLGSRYWPLEGADYVYIKLRKMVA